MAIALNGSNGLRHTTRLVSAGPVSMFVWVRRTSGSGIDDWFAGLGADAWGSAGQGAFQLEFNPTNIPSVWYGAQQGNAGGLSSNFGDTAAWIPILATYSGGSVKLYAGTNTAAQTGTLSASDTFANHTGASLGGFALGSAPSGFRGQLAEFTIWNTILSDADWASLKGGALPETVQAASVVEHWALKDISDLTGDKGRVFTVNGTGLTTVAHPITRTVPDTTVPTMTGSLTVGTVGTTSVQVSWTAATDNVAVASYETSLDGTTWTDRGNVLTYTFTGLTPSTAYTFRVRAKDAAGNVSTALSVGQITAAPDTTVPTMTGSLSVGTVTTTAIQVSWPAATDNVAVTSYETSLDGTTWTDRGNVLTYTFTGLTAATSYTARVRAKDAAGNVSTALTVTQSTASTADTTVPVMSGSITVSSITQTSYTVAGWGATDNVGVTGYEISYDAGSTWTNIGNVTSYNVTGRTPSTTDNIRVRAYDQAGNKATALSATATLLAPPLFSSGSLVRNNGSAVGTATLSWLKLVNRTTGADVALKTNVAVSNSLFSTRDMGMTAGTIYVAFWRESTGEYGWGEAAAA